MEQSSANGAAKSRVLPRKPLEPVACARCGKLSSPLSMPVRCRSHLGEHLCSSCDLLYDKLEHEEDDTRHENRKGVDYE